MGQRIGYDISFIVIQANITYIKRSTVSIHPTIDQLALEVPIELS